MTDNPFIKFWLWYYDVLWQYWPIVLVLTIIAVWLIVRRDAKKQREWNAYKKQRREKDKVRQLYESDVIEISNISEIKNIKKEEENETSRHQPPGTCH